MYKFNTQAYRTQPIFIVAVLLLLVPVFPNTANASVTINSGQASKISWITQKMNGSPCTVTNDQGHSAWAGTKSSVSGAQVFPPNTFIPASTLTYILTYKCRGLDGYDYVDSDKITVIPTPVVNVGTRAIGTTNPFLTLSFYPNRTTVTSNGTVAISWKYNDVNGVCTSSGDGWSAQARSANGAQVFTNNVAGGSGKNRRFNISCKSGASPALSAGFDVYYNLYTPYVPPETCFVAGTKVTLADGSTKSIEDIVVGDRLRGESGSLNTVTGIDTPPLGDRLLYSINGGKAFVTAEHPFMTKNGWKSIDPGATKRENPRLDVGALSVGDVLTTEAWNVPIRSITPRVGDPKEILYNLFLDGGHTYYADGYLVHNKMLP